jgi:hypothetical protein
MSSSKFGGIVDATRARQGGAPEPEPQQETRPEAKKANGKSSNPEYKQISAYIRRSTHRDAIKRLADEDGRRDLSDVIEELLSQWLKSDT